ncbi:MAG: hypothetical protein CMD16_03505 [Flavobacteriales bacterium]|nr:hypothetical protein [Flavobacteriales bacterium]
MKTHHTLHCTQEYEFITLAINSHSRGYKLCWNLNKSLGLSFKMTDNHIISKELIFTRYEAKDDDGRSFNLLPNLSKKGYLIPSQSRINYFLLINNSNWDNIKDKFLSKLRAINDILLVRELDVEKIKNSDRLIIYDKKN